MTHADIFIVLSKIPDVDNVEYYCAPKLTRVTFERHGQRYRILRSDVGATCALLTTTAELDAEDLRSAVETLRLLDGAVRR